MFASDQRERAKGWQFPDLAAAPGRLRNDFRMFGRAKLLLSHAVLGGMRFGGSLALPDSETHVLKLSLPGSRRGLGPQPQWLFSYVWKSLHQRPVLREG
jgi:hypothetical protein